MIDSSNLEALAGRTMTGADGSKIGKVVDVYESTEGVDGTFVTVATGLFGGHASFVPLARAEMHGDDIVVPYDKALVKDAPRVTADEELTSEEEDRLYLHYRLTGASTATSTVASTVASTVGSRDSDGDGMVDDVADTAVGRNTSGLTTDDAMTRSEERLQVGVERTVTGRARLRKRIVTETVTQTVPVTRQRAQVIREPITDANVGQALAGPNLSEEEHEVVLTDTVPVVTKETVPVERVRLATETVTGQARVDESVRKEQIVLDDSEVDGTTTRRG